MRPQASDDEEASLYRLLEVDPNSVLVHVRLGDLHAQGGKGSMACFHYRKALGLAKQRALHDGEAGEVRRAEAALAELEHRTYASRESQLAKRGFPPQAWSPRLRQALEIAASRLKPYAQEPTDFTFPGLPTVQFFDTAEFAWAAAVEAAAPAIRDELLRDMAQGTGDFRAYLQRHSGSAEANSALLNRKAWSVLALCEKGWVAPQVVARFPRTWGALQQAPIPAIYGWGPTVVFSMLKAGAHIPAHTGMFNTRLICHLPLIVPPGCRFRVGNEMREWEEGKLLIFDDTIEHEAWNEGSEDRIVLIFDIWRPELSEREKEELTALFHP